LILKLVKKHLNLLLIFHVYQPCTRIVKFKDLHGIPLSSVPASPKLASSNGRLAR
jgi:hypothetical protein